MFILLYKAPLKNTNVTWAPCQNIIIIILLNISNSWNYDFSDSSSPPVPLPQTSFKKNPRYAKNQKKLYAPKVSQVGKQLILINNKNDSFLTQLNQIQIINEHRLKRLR